MAKTKIATKTLFSLSELSTGLVATSEATAVGAESVAIAPEIAGVAGIGTAISSIESTGGSSLIPPGSKVFTTEESTFNVSRVGMVSQLTPAPFYDTRRINDKGSITVKEEIKEPDESLKIFQILDPAMIGAAINGVQGPLRMGERSAIIINPQGGVPAMHVHRVAGHFSAFPTEVTDSLARLISAKNYRLNILRDSYVATFRLDASTNCIEYAKSLFSIMLQLYCCDPDNYDNKKYLVRIANSMTNRLISRLSEANDPNLKTNNSVSSW